MFSMNCTCQQKFFCELLIFENIFLILQRIGEKGKRTEKVMKKYKKKYKKYGENTEKVRQKYETVSKK